MIRNTFLILTLVLLCGCTAFDKIVIAQQKSYSFTVTSEFAKATKLLADGLNRVTDDAVSYYVVDRSRNSYRYECEYDKDKFVYKYYRLQKMDRLLIDESVSLSVVAEKVNEQHIKITVKCGFVRHQPDQAFKKMQQAIEEILNYD